MSNPVESRGGPPRRLQDLTGSILSRVASQPSEVIEREREAKAIKEQAERQVAFFRERGRRYQAAELSGSHPKQLEVIAALKRYLANGDESLRIGQPIVMIGPPGTGKDWLLCALAKAFFGRSQSISIGWHDGQTLYAANRDRIDDGKSEVSFVDALVRPDVLILSDPLLPITAKETPVLTSAQASLLFRVLDKRASALKPTWISANLGSKQEGIDRMGSVNFERLVDGALVCWCSWPSYRKAKEVVGL